MAVFQTRQPIFFYWDEYKEFQLAIISATVTLSADKKLYGWQKNKELDLKGFERVGYRFAFNWTDILRFVLRSSSEALAIYLSKLRFINFSNFFGRIKPGVNI